MFGLDYEVAEEGLLGWSEMMPWKKKNSTMSFKLRFNLVMMHDNFKVLV